jgi:hydrogenase nickel incorporation protein HypA/HybF
VHEIGVTTEIIHIISSRMAEKGIAQVTRVTLEIGKLTALLPDSVRFCFDLSCQGTILEGASLEIIETSGSELRIKEVEASPCAEPADVNPKRK